jgi:D-tyrosyl-tRNA(Tyr) deacylase
LVPYFEVPAVIALIQRVLEASVRVEGEIVGRIGPGVLALVGVERGDGVGQARRLAERVLGYRVFADAEGRMNLSVADVRGGLLLVPQFTLAADTRKGLRASFGSAAAPEEGRPLFDALVEIARARHPIVATGRFGAHMRIALVNDGPVTFWLRASPIGAD